MRFRRKAAVAFLLLTALAACARRPRTTPDPGRAPERLGLPGATEIRVSLASGATRARVSGTTLLTVTDGSTGMLLGTGREGASWDVAPASGGGISLTRRDAAPIVVRDAPVVLRSEASAGFVVHEGRRYRGSIAIRREGNALLVVNWVQLEDYLKGVVPLEIGTRTERERAAVGAQAVAARSYTLARMATRRRDAARQFDFASDVTDQMYGGVDAELPLTTQMVEETRGQVLRYMGRIVEAVYSASCGGSTANGTEVWGPGSPAYLRSVSDRIPGSTGFYCDIAPRFSWTVSLSRSALVGSLDTHLKRYTRVTGAITRVDSITMGPRSEAGRVRSVAFATDAGRYEVTGDNIRFVLRVSGQEILRSTMFSLESAQESGAGVVRAEITGTGNGHGLGLCQWGAIGRARAGKNMQEILAAYYPGSTIERYAAAEEEEDPAW